MKHPRRVSLCALLLSAAMLFGAVPFRALAAEPTNSILYGQLEDHTSELYACFNGLAAGEEYFVIVSRSSSDPLAPENLLYLTQSAASEHGTLEIPFRAVESEAVYVAACRRELPDLSSHTITVTGGKATPETAAPGATVTITADPAPEGKAFSGWTVTSGDVTLADPSASMTTFVMGSEDVALTANFKESDTKADPDTPETPTEPEKPSSDGTTALLLLGAGAAAAVTAGVVLLMPVEVSGRVETLDHQPYSNARITLSQEGVLIAQTTTNAYGEFELKVRRGTYLLTLSCLNDNGELVQTSTSLHAPIRDLTLSPESMF